MLPWSYKNSSNWPTTFPSCSLSNDSTVNQSPINIVLKDIKQECAAKCELIIKYKPSKCYLVNDHNTITINYDPGSFIVYQGVWYELIKAKIHVPSLHSFNGQRFSGEISLYHSVDKQADSGIILSIPLVRGPDHGESVDFLNQFINQAPVNDTPVEREVSVSDNWNIVSLIPRERTCYIYNGTLPHPPCTSGWTWIVFGQPSRIGMTTLRTLQHNIVDRNGENTRTIMPVNNTSDIYKLPHDWVSVYEERPINKTIVKTDDSSNVPTMDPNLSSSVEIDKTSLLEQYFNKYRKKLKNLMLFILIVLIIVISIKMAKYIIRNDIVNKYLVPADLGVAGDNYSMNQGNMNMGNMNQDNMNQGNMNMGNMNQGNMGNLGNMNQGNMGNLGNMMNKDNTKNTNIPSTNLGNIKNINKNNPNLVSKNMGNIKKK
jgi:carbonic anhydrase